MSRIFVPLLLLLVACSGTGKQGASEPDPNDKWALPASRQEDERKPFKYYITDELDGAFDVSNFVELDLGFLPLVIPITEPAVGFGLAGGLVFFHDKGKPTPGVPPTITAVVAGATTNGTWLGGVVHQHVWKGGDLRYVGGVGYGSIELDFFGLGAGPGDDNASDLNFEGVFLLQDIRHRIGSSDWFLGLDYTFTNVDTVLELAGPVLPPFRFANTSSGIGALAHYDTRNSHFTPSKGIDALLGVRFYGEAIGSDRDFMKVRGKFRTWLPLGERVTLGLRLDGEAVSSDAPLYELPFVKLRGVPAFRYVDDVAVMAEIEPRFQITPRWGAVLFAGVGATAGDISDISDDNTVWSVGVGVRYLLARRLGLQAGIDVAYSDDDVAFYITVGSAWMR